MAMRPRSACLAIALLLSSAAAQEESKIKLYGFIDMLTSYRALEDNSLFHSLTLNDGVQIGLEHVNLYVDARPSDDIRMLAELSFRAKPVKSGAVLGADVKVNAGNGLVMTIPVDTAELADRNTDDNPDLGVVLEWGSFALERAWAEYTVREWLTFRFGKFITPAGIWNVDHGSPVLISVRQPYETGLMQFFPKSQIGLMGLGSAFAGPVNLDYSVYVSSGRNGIDIQELRDLAGGAHIGGSTGFRDDLVKLSVGVSGYSGMDNQAYKKRTITVDSLTVLSFVLQSMFETGIFDQNDSTVQARAMEKIEAWLVAEGLNPKYHSYGTTYEYQARETSLGCDVKLSVQRFLLQMEMNYELIQNYLSSASQTKQFGFYAMASYGIPLGAKVRLTPYFMFERITARGSDNNPQVYLSGAKTGTGASIVDGFQSYVGGLNLKLSSYLTIKAEYVFIDVIMGGALKDVQDAMDMSIGQLQFAVAF